MKNWKHSEISLSNQLTLHDMTLNEITALRKSGRLREALDAAEIEFKKNQNVYTASALFWCLHAMCKTLRGEDAEACVEIMRKLHEAYGQGDKFMTRAMTRYSSLSQELQKASNDAKSGADVTEVYTKVLDLFRNGELEAGLHEDFGWLIYHRLKMSRPDDALGRKRMLNYYLQLNVERPSMLHSLILAMAIELEKSTPLEFRMRDFIRLWGLENLREEDWQQFRTDEGHTASSNVEKLIKVYATELKTDKVEAPDEFVDLVDKALEKFPNNQNLPYYKALTLISKGEREEATKYYRDLMQKYPAKHYLYHHTMTLVDNLDRKIGLLAKALTLGVDEQFLGKVRIAMAKLLIEKGFPQNAKAELKLHGDFYKKNGWHLSNDFQTLWNQLGSVSPVENNKALYKEYIPIADDFILGALPTITAVKVAEREQEDKLRPGKKNLVWVFKTEQGVLRLKKPSKFGLPKRLNNGAVLDVKVSGRKIVGAKMAEAVPALNWLKEADGIVRICIDRNGKRYAILAHTYVPENLLAGVKEGERIKVTCVMGEDRKWKALALKRVEGR